MSTAALPEGGADDEPITIGAEHLDARVDFERGMSPIPLVTIGLIVVHVVVFAVELVRGALATPAAIVAAGAKDNASIAKGELWRLLSPAFLHGSPGHLIGNAMAFYVLGMGCEHAFGRVRTLNLYVATAVVASLFSCISERPSVGASGAIFGLMGALSVAVLANARDLHVRDKRVGVVLLFWATWTIGTGVLDPNVDNWAHLGGFVGGSFFGLLTSIVIVPARPARTGVLLVASTVLCVGALLYSGAFFVPALAGR